MKEIIKVALFSAYERFQLCISHLPPFLFQGSREFQFEIFGFDFMIDSQA
jgi:hypothetical protein